MVACSSALTTVQAQGCFSKRVFPSPHQKGDNFSSLVTGKKPETHLRMESGIANQ
jgi:hypothetical protein